MSAKSRGEVDNDRDSFTYHNVADSHFIPASHKVLDDWYIHSTSIRK
jgi:hypothetical protein